MRANNASKSLSINTFILLFLQTQVFAQFTVSNIKVEYVLDGDTFIAFINSKKERIRMKCIDAPELKQTFIDFDGVKQEIGIEAREYLLSMIAKSDLVELKCSDERDKYGRLTCDVFDYKGGSLNLQMVKDGYAYAMPSQCFSQADGMMYLGYQYVARFGQVGLWRHGVWDESWRWRNV
jgi:micrococcal nuclease